MQRVKVRRSAEITLPEEAWRKFGVSEGDYLEVEVVEDGVLLRPAADQEQAWNDIFRAIVGVEPTPEQAAEPIEQQEADIVEEIKAARCEDHAGSGL